MPNVLKCPNLNNHVKEEKLLNIYLKSEIVITTANKEGAVVITETKDYIKEA